MPAFFEEKKRMPHDRELVAITGLRPTHARCTLVEHVLTGEPLAKEAMGRLLPERRCAHLPLLGTVTADFPSPAEEELLDTMTLDALLITNREAIYLLTVTGESMIEAGILPGDWLLVERGVAPRDGHIVVAQVDREWTLKFFRRRGRTVFLEAGNRAFKPIYPTEELTIAAVVRVVIRRYS
jgi:SOS-response transcriptional repressor LexA